MSVASEWTILVIRSAKQTLHELDSECKEALDSIDKIPPILRTALGLGDDTLLSIGDPIQCALEGAKAGIRRCGTEADVDAWLKSLPEWIRQRVEGGFWSLRSAVLKLAKER